MYTSDIYMKGGLFMEWNIFNIGWDSSKTAEELLIHSLFNQEKHEEIYKTSWFYPILKSEGYNHEYEMNSEVIELISNSLISTRLKHGKIIIKDNEDILGFFPEDSNNFDVNYELLETDYQTLYEKVTLSDDKIMNVKTIDRIVNLLKNDNIVDILETSESHFEKRAISQVFNEIQKLKYFSLIIKR